MDIIATTLSDLNLPTQTELSIITEICEWERIEYGEGKHRTPLPFHQCVKKNKFGFFILTHKEKLLGYADIWELSTDFYSNLRSGLIDEESLAEEFILGPNEKHTSLWYIGSIITNPAMRNTHPTTGALAFARICNSLPNFFRKNSSFPSKILGVGSSHFGVKLLTKWGFSPTTPDSNAIDHRPRFEKTMHSPEDADSLYIGRHAKNKKQ